MALLYTRSYENITEPYIGPRSFELKKEDQERFFGRDKEVDEIISLIYSHKIVLIYAPSGAGKSSIFNGKIIPDLEKEGFKVIPITRVGISSTIKALNESLNKSNNEVLYPPNLYIVNAIQSILANSNPHQKFLEQIPKEMTLSKFLEKNYPPDRNPRRKIIPQLLIFDQFEELFNYYPEKWQEQQQNFFSQITEALNNNPLLRIVLIIREDYIAQLDPFKEFVPEKLRPRYRLERLSEKAALLAIKKPLEKALSTSQLKEYTVEIQNIIEELLKVRVETFGKNIKETKEAKGSYIEPIHLQVVCQRWWKERIVFKKDNDKFQNKKEDFADVDKALEDFYEDAINEAIAQQNYASEDKIREFCETKLITPSETRGIVYEGEKSTEGIPMK